jgi:hypothetical protein
MSLSRQIASFTDRYFVTIISVIIGCKILVSLFVQVEYDGDRQVAAGLDWQWRKDYGAIFSGDEYEIARTAMYHMNGEGFLADNSFDRPKFRISETYKTAFRPKFHVFLHVFGISLYNRLHPEKAVTITDMQRGNPLASGYMYYFALFTFLIQIIFYPLSVYAFYQMSRFFINGVHPKVCTILYALYPSVFIFMDVTVGEKMVGPMVVIFIGSLTASTRKQLNAMQIILLAALATFSCLMRPQVLLVWIILFAAYAVGAAYFFWKFRQRPMGIGLVITSCLFIGLAYFPILHIHYKDFGKPFLSSEVGLGFFQGHNWYARGSWYPGIWHDHSGDEEMKRMFASADLKNMDEKQELDFYESQGWRFIRENPLKEAELIARKTAIYLLPYNFMNHRINVFLLFAHLGTIGFFLFSARKRIFKSVHPARITDYAIIVSPVIACYLITIIFFVGERWRFYAEPFMLLLAYLFFWDVREKFLVKSMQKKHP